ncbi:hypothetical protein SAMN05660776_1359 [Salegentibacter holothuriorum]|uniref:Uncharacterized protein n=1 Tax=Salegentibacter holothuriorum TaxID=241145 RepID=A0A1T5BNS8_9FLAO|nr:hypothetical protein [Salegentibacter holothuriorum]SKB48878.1 hypothetical protein SAMN05660776_1359 [Salegentibacter holothuriorum]
MNLTFGFIAFFIAIIIPGILFRRFFYYGEFSKQFDSKDPVLHSVFYSIVPGVCIQTVGFLLADAFIAFQLENTDIYNIFNDFVYSGQKDIKNDTVVFLNNSLDIFIYYSLYIFLFAIIVGHLSARFIRLYNWDKKYKIFKFQNQWFYIFSGELLHFRKFEQGRNIASADKELLLDHKFSTTYADVMISNSEGNRELYTGYVADYDLKADDITKLERIYLLDAYRYKKIPKDTKVNQAESSYSFTIESEHQEKTEKAIEEDEIENKIYKKSRLRKKIPGNVFVVDGKNIININLTYVPSEKKKEIRENFAASKKEKMAFAYLLVFFIILAAHISYKLLGLEGTLWGNYVLNSSVIGIMSVVLVLIQISSLLIPLVFSLTHPSTDDTFHFTERNLLLQIGILILFIGIAIILETINEICWPF